MEILGTTLDDLLSGSADADLIRGLDGSDILSGQGGDDVLVGGAGSDTLDGGGGHDTYRLVAADEGSIDTYMDSGSAGVDRIDMRAFLIVGFASTFGPLNGIEVIIGNPDLETILSGDADGVDWDFRSITLTNIKRIVGTSIADRVSGSAGNDRIATLGGADQLNGADGRDELDGGAGNDTVSGGNGHDLLYGAAGDDRVQGGDGSDFLDGGTGNDRLEGGTGDDVLIFDVDDTTSVDGGKGVDTLRVVGNGTILNLVALNGDVSDPVISGIEIVDLAGNANIVHLTPETVAGLSDTSNTLRVLGNAKDVVSAGRGLWVDIGTMRIDGVLFRQFESGNAVLQAQVGVNMDSILQPWTMELSALDGSNGFAITGIGSNDHAGNALHAAGDFNGDGFADVIIGARYANPDSRGDAGESYVIFGSASEGDAEFRLTRLNGANGFRFEGGGGGDRSGYSVAGAGDINGDGYDDVLVGAFLASVGSDYAAGSGYLVYGRNAGSPTTLEPLDLNGTNGFTLSGIDALDRAGRSVSSAGDVNGDGYDDMLIGANSAMVAGKEQAGETYIVFGSPAGFEANFALESLNGANGVKLSGVRAIDRSGSSVSSAGDVNGDGFDDVVIGAELADPGNRYAAGECYLVFGRGAWPGANLNLSTLNGSNGMRLIGVEANSRLGYSVSAAGDVNGDGFDDIIVGANGYGSESAGSAYVIFGKASGFPAVLAVNTLNGANGFRIDGIGDYDGAGTSVGAAGDVNGDGFDDVIIGAPNAGDSGEAYVVFGASTFSDVVELATLDQYSGMRFLGARKGLPTGVAVSGAGDVNGDGFDDLLISDHGWAGVSYVVYGWDVSGSVDLPGTDGRDVLSGGSRDEVIIGGLGNDVLRGNDGKDVLKAAAGHDMLSGGGSADHLKGGSGNDSLDGGGGVDRLTGDAGADTLNGGAGNDRLAGGHGNDNFLFSTTPGAANVDTIVDFGGAGNRSLDRIQLDNAVFSSLTTVGNLSSGNFVSGLNPVAHDASDHILYNTITGELFYDADGNGSVASVKFAVIATDPNGLTAADFVVI